MKQNKSDIEVAVKFCSEARLSHYLRDSHGDSNKAIQLCRWNHDFAGIVHQQIGYVEIAVRNTIDRALRQLAFTKTGNEFWTNQGNEPVIVYKIIRKPIENARNRAYKEHPDGISHDDVVAKLMWGTWLKLIGEDIPIENQLQQNLWTTSLFSAFPNVQPNEQGRLRISRNLSYLRSVRNKAAHFDNLTETAEHKRRVINASLFLLHAIDDDFTHGWFQPNTIRQEARKRDTIMAAAEVHEQ
ncbi:hypothetical protein OZX73_02385 [Bifidobacterium sp. ESL0775]|uniref:hypothetical protein n=1 Tax=Bifidobacterium sp. ESL0775 TaxID=2983230 RepID=UPI0023F8694F|nr:hypothetical protein [Bifidobacterium sp. ESL0775]WEV69747.1 hypothetical protein OZX73_02385 [Bifidobacterium sp. ESL0775]